MRLSITDYVINGGIFWMGMNGHIVSAGRPMVAGSVVQKTSDGRMYLYQYGSITGIVVPVCVSREYILVRRGGDHHRSRFPM